MTKEISGWGRHPFVNAHVYSPSSALEIEKTLQVSQKGPLITRGLGRSYGDSSLSQNILSNDYLDHYLNFNESSGLLTCQSAVSFRQIIKDFLPRGWFLPVTPGTQFITVGGAVAADVHGKNHHNSGCFSDHVESLRLITSQGQVIECSRALNSDLFFATCGGMGLTGFILEVSFFLKKVSSAYISQRTFKARNLEHAFQLFETHKDATYSVAWIDCLAKGASMGRSLLMLGEQDTTTTEKTVAPEAKLKVPFEMPGFLLSPLSMRAFNFLYYNKQFVAEKKSRVHLHPYFYPLDAISHWNLIYGKKGFVQYQCVLPLEQSFEGIKALLEKVSTAQKASFLAVLKLFGEENKNFISFPIKGYTLALDMKFDESIPALLAELDKIVLRHQGRVYLAKDAHMSAETFKESYPRWPEFVKTCEKYSPGKLWLSRQAQRLEIFS